MKDIDRHLLLYAKGHYTSSDNIMQDLRTIISRVNWLPMNCVKPQDILQVLLDVTFRVLKEQETFDEEKAKNIISRASPGQPEYIFSEKAYDFYRAFSRALLTELMSTDCYRDGETILKTGDPDPEVLPPVEKRLSIDAKMNNEGVVEAW